VLAPIGFLSDHMEVLYDLDTEAANLCRELGVNIARAGAVGVHPAFIGTIREMIVEASAGCAICPAGCCPAPRALRSEPWRRHNHDSLSPLLPVAPVAVRLRGV